MLDEISFRPELDRMSRLYSDMNRYLEDCFVIMRSSGPSPNHVCFPLSIKELVELVGKWVGANKNDQFFARSWYDEEFFGENNLQLPVIDADVCSKEGHSGTIVDLGGKVRCSYKTLSRSSSPCYEVISEVRSGPISLEAIFGKLSYRTTQPSFSRFPRLVALPQTNFQVGTGELAMQCENWYKQTPVGSAPLYKSALIVKP